MNAQRSRRLPHSILVLGLLAMTDAEVASAQPSMSEPMAATHANVESDVKQDLRAIREVVAAMPNAQAAQLIIEARSLLPLEIARAEQLCRQALALLVDDADQPHRWGVLYMIGRLLHAQERFPEAETFFREAQAVALKYYAADSTAVFETTATLAWHTIRTDRAAALSLASQAEPLIERKDVQHKPLDLALDRILLAEVFYDLQETERSEKLLLAVLNDPDYERLSYYHRARVLGRLGMINNVPNNAAQAITYLEQSLAAWNEIEIDPKSRQEIGVNHLTLGNLFLDQQEMTRAEAHYRLAAGSFKITGRTETRAKALTMLGNTLLMQNRREEARDALAEGYQLHKQNNTDGVAYAAGLYGHVLAQLKDYAAAVPVLRDAQLGYSQMPGHDFDVAYAVYERGMALWLDERPCDSRDALQEAQVLRENVSPAQRANLSKFDAVATNILSMPNLVATCARQSVN